MQRVVQTYANKDVNDARDVNSTKAFSWDRMSPVGIIAYNSSCMTVHVIITL